MKKNMLMGYAGFCKGCGELTAVVMDVPGCEHEAIIGLALYSMEGLEIRRMTFGEISSRLGSCQCGKHGQVQPGQWPWRCPDRHCQTGRGKTAARTLHTVWLPADGVMPC
jgi:hypothetical protein